MHGAILLNALVGNPTNVATGNKYEEVLDLSISTPGIPLEFRRSYNSQVISDGPLGYGWTHTYDVSLEAGGRNDPDPTKESDLGLGWPGPLLSQDQQTNPDGFLCSGESGVQRQLKQDISTGRILPPPKRRKPHLQISAQMENSFRFPIPMETH